MEVNFVSPSAFMSDWLATRMHDKNMLVRRSVNDYVSRLLTSDQLTTSIALIDVKDSIGILPSNFKAAIQVAYGLPKHNHQCTRENVVKWIGKEENCDYEISVKCHKCNKKNCKCSEPIATLNVGSIDIAANPQWVEHRRVSYMGYGKVGDNCYSSFNPHFLLMKPSTNHFFNINYHIKNCVNYHVTSDVEYKIFDRKIEVNIKECKVLIAYIGYYVDSKGLLMVPDIAEVWSGLRYYVDSKIAYDKYINTYDPKFERAFRQLDSLADREAGIAKIKLGRLPLNRLRAIWDDFYGRKIPNYYHEENLGGYLTENNPRL